MQAQRAANADALAFVSKSTRWPSNGPGHKLRNWAAGLGVRRITYSEMDRDIRTEGPTEFGESTYEIRMPRGPESLPIANGIPAYRYEALEAAHHDIEERRLRVSWQGGSRSRVRSNERIALLAQAFDCH